MFWPDRLKVPFHRQLVLYVALPLVYIICGRLGLLLAVPPGFATAIFVPAGIAVAAMFVAGTATLPGTFLGSFLLNIWISYAIAQRLDVIAIEAALIIAFSSMIQAGAGGALLRKLIGYPASFDNLRDLLLFLLLSPLVCLISATLSLSGLMTLLIVPWTDLLRNWLTWWIGDTLGVLVALPLTLMLVGEPRPLWRSRMRLVAVPMILSFALFVVISMHVTRWESEQALSQFRWAVLAAGALSTGLLGCLLLLGTGRAKRIERQLAAIVESSDDAIISKDLNGVITTWNRAAERLFGYLAAEVIGKPITILFPTDRLNENLEILGRIHRGEHIDRFETVRRRKDGSLVNVSLSISPISDESGKIVGASKIARDITDRKRIEDRQKVLMAELDHRVKNVLARVEVMAMSTRQSSNSVDDFVDSLRGRIQSMAVAHKLLSQSGWWGVGLNSLVHTQLAPYAANSNITISGADLTLAATDTQALAMALHELVTNAAKYGALSVPDGHVSVSWERKLNGDATATLMLEWRELGGPPVAPDVQSGYGTGLIRNLVPHELGGKVDLVFDSGGVICKIEIPLETI